MASVKAEKTPGAQPAAPVKEPPKPSNTAPRAPASKPASAPVKADQKPREPRRKATGSKPAAKSK